MWNSSIWTIDRTLLRARVDLGAMVKKGVFCLPQISSFTWASPSDCLVFYPGHSLGVGLLLFCRDAVNVFYSLSRLGFGGLEMKIVLLIRTNSNIGLRNWDSLHVTVNPPPNTQAVKKKRYSVLGCSCFEAHICVQGGEARNIFLPSVASRKHWNKISQHN